MIVTKDTLRRDGRDLGYAAAQQAVVVSNPYKPGSWQHKAYQEGLSCGKQLAQLRSPQPQK